MRKSEIFQVLLDIVCSCTEVAADSIILQNRTEDVVIARCLIVVYGKEYGLTNKNLQDLLRLKSHSSITYYINMYSKRYATDKHFHTLATYTGHELDKTLTITSL